MWRCSCVSLNLSPEIVGAILAEFLRDLTATFNQLATPWTAVRILVGAIEDRSGVGEKFAKPVDHQAFQIASRYPPAARTGPSRSGDEGGRNIVPIARSLLDRMGWRQALAGLIKNHAAQQAGVACARSRCPWHGKTMIGLAQFMPCCFRSSDYHGNNRPPRPDAAVGSNIHRPFSSRISS